MEKTITIRFDGEEYRVPGRNPKREEEAYYTNDKSDAVRTAQIIHGDCCSPDVPVVKVRRVEAHS